MNSEYASIGDQSGLFAGNGGYDIYVGNHTQLNGAVIASTAQAANNALSTGTLGWSDIDNHASYKASSSSISMGGGNEDNKMSGGAIPTSANTHGSASGTTRSAVADGTITVRNSQAQTQNVADLSRDTDNANGHIDKIFDKDKVARKLEFAQGIQELGQRVAGDVSSYKMQAAEDETRERLLKANPQLAGYSTDALNTLIVNDPGYKAVAEKWGTGGSYSMAAAAVTGVLGGLGASNLGAAAAGGMAPYIANKIKQATSKVVDGQEQTNVLANTMAHAVAGAVLAQLAGNNATAGAAGAAGGELMARAILSSMYPGKQASELTQEQKQVVSALGQLAAQLSAGVTSGSVEGGIQGAVAGKNAVENNALSPVDFGQGMADYAQAQTSLGTSMIQSGASADEISAALAKAAQGDMPEGQDAAKGLLIAWAEFFGVPVSPLTADGEMTPQRAAEILASGIPASEAKLVQYVAAKAYLTIAKSADLGLSAENQKYVDILSPEAKQHILYGDSPTQGGHLYPGNPGKTVFPQSWSADKVVHVVGDIATSPDTQWFAQTGTGEAYTKAGKPARWVAWSEQDGVRVRVVYEPASGKIVTAFPDSNPTPPTLKPIKN
ncbi:VENN motif pre-toxin domain-containing protein [Pantoea agglomerans]|uniref:VENN motif pre-toxin domain-containing protein n=1 Tax=Enterobacter agglomerans TaxID=549 RepID=UPI0023B7D6E9|nr:VENN motif pre-toxin domain-containing protein [Pantoea agglomerans]